MQKFTDKVQLITICLFLLFSSACKKSIVISDTVIYASDTDIVTLPPDLGGIQTGVNLNSNILYGYYVYTPSGYSSNQANYPLLVFLHGSGEVGNSMVTPNDLKKILKYGPPELINIQKWAPKYPMIVVSPQSTVNGFNPTKLNDFITYLISKYRINTHRIYLTGLSMGGGATYNYIANFPNGYAAAGVPMSAAFDKQPNYSALKNTPLWTFCGGNDSPLAELIKTTDAIIQLNPPVKPKLTVFPGVGHNCWDLAYSGSGMKTESNSYDAFNMSIYDWMFQYVK